MIPRRSSTASVPDTRASLRRSSVDFSQASSSFRSVTSPTGRLQDSDAPSVDSAMGNASREKMDRVESNPDVLHRNGQLEEPACVEGPTTIDSQTPRPEGEKDGVDGLLALLGDQFEMFEVNPVGASSKKLSPVLDANEMRTRKGPLLLRRRVDPKGAQDTTYYAGGAPQVPDGDIDQLDYEKRYPPDKPGESMGPNARVWRVYLNEAGQFDADMVEKMRDTVDVILIIAALFAAIVTSLVAITTAAIQLDQPKVTNLLLMELIDLQRAQLSNSPIDSIAHYPIHADSPATDTANWTDFVATRLWFASLALSVSTALVAMLVRQWIHSYVAPTFQGTAKSRAEVRHFRFYGFDAWRVPLIIDLLPTLLHLSLFLFFAGLVIFLHPLDHIIEILVAALACMVFVIYVITNSLPVWFASCPYKTPLSPYVFTFVQSCKAGYHWLWSDLQAWIESIWEDSNSESDLSSRWEEWFAVNVPYGTSNEAAQFRRAFRVAIALLYLPVGCILRAPWYLLATAHSPRSFPEFLRFLFRPLWSLHYNMPEDTPPSLKVMEANTIRSDEDTLHAGMCIWLLETSSNPSARSIATSIALRPTDLAHVQPPFTSKIEWARILQRAVTAQVTHPRHHLVQDSFGPYDTLPVVDMQFRGAIDGLLSVNLYNRRFPSGYIDEEAFNLSSYPINWDDRAGAIALAGHTSAHRLCVHMLFQTTPLSSSTDLASLLGSTDHLSRLIPAMRIITDNVRATPIAFQRLKIWLPSPAQINDLGGITAPQLQLLLEIAAFLLRLDSMDFKNAFTEADCLSFWRSVLISKHDLITEDSIDAFARMLDSYADYDNIPRIYDHLGTACMWEAVQHTYSLPSYLDRLIRRDPWNTAWQEVQDTLLDILPDTEEAMDCGAVFLETLHGNLVKARAARAMPRLQGLNATEDASMIPQTDPEPNIHPESSSMNLDTAAQTYQPSLVHSLPGSSQEHRSVTQTSASSTRLPTRTSGVQVSHLPPDESPV